jgi:hypothetical protein
MSWFIFIKKFQILRVMNTIFESQKQEGKFFAAEGKDGSWEVRKVR